MDKQEPEMCRKCVTYIRNLYKTAKIYGQKSYDIKNERFIRAVKCCEKLQYAFPICDDPSLIPAVQVCPMVLLFESKIEPFFQEVYPEKIQ